MARPVKKETSLLYNEFELESGVQVNKTAWFLSLGTWLMIIMCSNVAAAQLQEEVAESELEQWTKKARGKEEEFWDKSVTLEKNDYQALFRYEAACFRRLVPISSKILNCVDAQRFTSGEFGATLKLVIEPNGEITSIKSPEHAEQMRACILPHMLGITFPKFKKREVFQLVVMVSSQGRRLGQRSTLKNAVTSYTLDSEKERKAYRMALMWSFLPWTQGIGHCTEWIDQIMGFGYEVKVRVLVDSKGLPVSAKIKIRGKQARKAQAKLVGCISPFISAMVGPGHLRNSSFTYDFRTRTARWLPE